MPSQQVEILETIAALHRALKKDTEASSDQSTVLATNRYNKLKIGSKFTHAGAMPHNHNRNGYKEKIEHAGYTRYILNRNPRRYNNYGDELEDSESDRDADADAEDENAYSALRLEELLCPLKHPHELATHPTLAAPFLDRALPDMIEATEETLRLQRANLWRAKNVNRELVGDRSWIPCGRVEDSNDWELFEPLTRHAEDQTSRKRKLDEYVGENKFSEVNKPPRVNGVNLTDSNSKAGYQESDRFPAEKKDVTIEQETTMEDAADPGKEPQLQQELDDAQMDLDTFKPDRPDTPKINGFHKTEAPNKANNHELAQSPQTEDQIPPNVDTSDVLNVENESMNDSENEDVDKEGGTPLAPTRRITRALAASNTSNAASPPPSPTLSSGSSVSSALHEPDPIFLLSPSIHISAHLPAILTTLALPTEEFLETRRLLTMYIQKQEESVRGYEAVLAKLIKAKRMREQVWEWCKAEGHVGEMSDGEDWIDYDQWGLEEGELRKGRDEDDNAGNEDEGMGIGGRKKRRRGGGKE